MSISQQTREFIMELDIIQEMLKCLETKVFTSLQTGKLVLDAHPMVPADPEVAFPTLTYGDVHMSIRDAKSCDEAFWLLQDLEKSTITEMRRNNIDYVKRTGAKVSFIFEHGYKCYYLVRKERIGEASCAVSRVKISYAHLIDFIETILAIEIDKDDWSICTEEGNINTGSAEGYHWMLMPTGRQAQFALSTHDDFMTFMNTMVINVEEIPAIVDAFNRDVAVRTGDEYDVNPQWAGHKYSWAGQAKADSGVKREDSGVKREDSGVRREEDPVPVSTEVGEVSDVKDKGRLAGENAETVRIVTSALVTVIKALMDNRP